MFIFPSAQFLLKVQTEVFCVNDLLSVGITPMFSPPEGDTSVFRCFATIAVPFYLSLMTLSCSKHIFLPMGLCILFSVTVWTSLPMHTFTFTIQTHTFKATSSLIQITFESQMWTFLLVSYHTCVCVWKHICMGECQSKPVTAHLMPRVRILTVYGHDFHPLVFWNTVLMWFTSSMLSSRLSPAEQSLSTNYCWRYSVSKPLCSSLATEMKSDC